MAKHGFHISILFFVAIYFTSALSRRLQRNVETTAVLDVSGSMRRTRHVLSFDPQSVDSTEATTSSSSSASALTLRLLPRASLRKPSHSDYRSLTLARLERDSARVRSINSRLDLAANGVARADLTPEFTESKPEDPRAPIVSGTKLGSGEYFSRLLVGTPPKPVYMVLDTGSDVNWLQCAPCGECYQQSDPIFDPASSSSYSQLTCAASQCKSLDVSRCRNGSCLYEVAYGDGSFTVGDFVTERLTLGEVSVDGVAIGCGHTNEGLFVGAAGLLGLGGGVLSFPSQINASSFSYCLVDRDSSNASSLEFGSPLPAGAGAVTAPLLKNPQLDTFYYVGLKGLSVGGKAVEIPAAAFEMNENGDGVIVDSGTAVTRLQADAYESLKRAFERGTRHLTPASGVALFDTCYDLSSMGNVEVPTVSFNFEDGGSLDLPAKNYLIPVDESGTFCFAFAPTTASLSIIGNVQQQGTRVSFDLANSRVGFSPSNC